MRAVSAQFQGDWRHHVEVYWTGSVAGALSAGLLWRVMQRTAEEKPKAA